MLMFLPFKWKAFTFTKAKVFGKINICQIVLGQNAYPSSINSLTGEDPGVLFNFTVL